MLIHRQAQDVASRIPFALDLALVSSLGHSVLKQWIRILVHNRHHIELEDRAFHSSEESW